MLTTLLFGAALLQQDFAQLIGKYEPRQKPKLLIVGFYHFDNPGLDLAKADLDDHRSPKRQSEIEHLVGRLAGFKPTKVAVEYPVGDDRIQKRYEAWRTSGGELRASETEQVGFRLAKQSGHARVFPIDHKLDLDFGTFMQGADPDTLKAFQSTIADVQQFMGTFKERTVSENLRLMNSPTADRFTNGIYLRMARVGTDADQPGAELAADWWKRNLLWLGSLARVANNPEDRVILICGSGHASILRSILRDSIDFEVVDPMPFLQ
jgi:hypothetical protein